jgi:hypothetical protein
VSEFCILLNVSKISIIKKATTDVGLKGTCLPRSIGEHFVRQISLLLHNLQCELGSLLNAKVDDFLKLDQLTLLQLSESLRIRTILCGSYRSE